MDGSLEKWLPDINLFSQHLRGNVDIDNITLLINLFKSNLPF